MEFALSFAYTTIRVDSSVQNLAFLKQELVTHIKRMIHSKTGRTPRAKDLNAVIRIHPITEQDYYLAQATPIYSGLSMNAVATRMIALYEEAILALESY